MVFALRAMVLLGSWLPIVGDPITVVAGALEESFWQLVGLVTLA